MTASASKFIASLEPIADALGLGVKQLLDDLIAIECCRLAAFWQEYQGLYPVVELSDIIQNPRLNSESIRPNLSQEKFETHLKDSVLLLTEYMKSAQPFQDMLTDVYAGFLGSQKGQFMTPPSLAAGVMGFLNPNLDRPLKVAEIACGTGILALEHLRYIYEKSGADGIIKVDCLINDIDLSLVRVAMYQVMFHSIRTQASLKFLRVLNMNGLMVGASPDVVVFVARGWKDSEAAV